MPLELAVFHHVWLAPNWNLLGGHHTFGLVAWLSTAMAKESREIWGFIAADYLIDLY
jgi:hypothetical protein